MEHLNKAGTNRDDSKECLTNKMQRTGDHLVHQTSCCRPGEKGMSVQERPLIFMAAYATQRNGLNLRKIQHAYLPTSVARIKMLTSKGSGRINACAATLFFDYFALQRRS